MRTNESEESSKPNQATTKSKKRPVSAAPASPVKKRSARRSEPIAQLSEQLGASECPVTFAYLNPEAKSVLLAGAFNGWAGEGAPLTRSGDGRWTTTLLLQPGTYEYRFIVDGVWQEDPTSGRFAANPFGGRNSVLVVNG